ncbi:hypothetical protein CWM57_24975 [Klebsiella sp. G-Nf4]|nr:hypothetical protein CWM64_24825 [Klebsiella sp. I-Nf8]PJX67482.1 hypothetical protein CWM57_24975 [Klebsiella sp. G-Nf4]PJX72864.1 hypothetical protein CWM55_23395 [Klebsiella sp. G2-16S-Nf13]PKJ73140.1 hypothetical protein CWM65_25130 [Klebsiella sp. J-Nf11]
MRADCHTYCPEQAICACACAWGVSRRPGLTRIPQSGLPAKLPCFQQRMETYSCIGRKSYLPERLLFASSPVRSLRSVSWLRRALLQKSYL